MLEPFEPAFVTLFAELDDRVADARLIEGLPAGGTFQRRTINGRDYWYHRAYSRATGKVVVRYVGAVTPDLDRRVERQAALKPDVQGRRRIVSSLRRAGFPGPDPLTGEILAALARSGLFRLRACLVGTVAYQSYSALLGVRLPMVHMRTQDLDLAQFHGVAVSIGEASEPVIDALREVDPSFALVPSLSSPSLSNVLANRQGYRIELLTPHQGADERADRLLPLPTIPGLAARPLRFLDFLIREEVATTVLHGAGERVNVPAPERYAVHKLIVATRRHETGRVKAAKDVAQAASLIQALIQTRQAALLVDVWREAEARGPVWRRALRLGAARLDLDSSRMLAEALDATPAGS